MENWKPIPGYEGLYEASDQGRIRSCYGKMTSNARYDKRVWKSREIKPRASSTSRKDLKVNLWKDGKPQSHLVARLIAMAWIGIPQSVMTVNHINGDFRDNRPENLEWVTHSDNIKIGFEMGLYDSIKKSITIKCDSVSLSFTSLSDCDRYLCRRIGYTSNALRKGTSLRNKSGITYTVISG